MAAKKEIPTPVVPSTPSKPVKLSSVMKVKAKTGEREYEVTREYYEAHADRLTVVE